MTPRLPAVTPQQVAGVTLKPKTPAGIIQDMGLTVDEFRNRLCSTCIR